LGALRGSLALLLGLGFALLGVLSLVGALRAMGEVGRPAPRSAAGFRNPDGRRRQGFIERLGGRP
jgi:hypothetical protein